MAVVTTWRGKRSPAKVVEGLLFAAESAEALGLHADAREYTALAEDIADSLDAISLPAVNGDVTLPATPWTPARLHAV